MRIVLILMIGVCGIGFRAKPARAQDGQLIEGLFRTWANSQVEKEKRKRMEAEARAAETSARRAENEKGSANNRDPYEVQLPSGFGRPSANGPERNIPPANRTSPVDRLGPSVNQPVPGRVSARRRPINVRSREAAEYAQGLVQFTADFDRLLAELRSASPRNIAVGALMPKAYEVAATCETLIDQLEGLDSLSAIAPSHQALDRRYRHVSFRVRSVDGLSQSCRDLVGRCDQSCAAMAKQMALEPQFDREALGDLLMTAATYMQALVDDLELSQMDRAACRSLQHECRLLRQRLIAANREINAMPYDECVARFREFIVDWTRYSERVYAIQDPYLSRRLDRIGQCADQTYGLLWLPPPTSMSEVAAIAHRVEYDLKEISKSLTIFSISNLAPRDQASLLGTMRELISTAIELERQSQGGGSQPQLATTFARLDQAWCSVKPLLGDVSSVRVGLIAKAERGFQQLRDVFKTNAPYATPVRFADLVSIAAALEGTSEHLHKTLESYDHDLEPASYRRHLTDTARSFYRHSREVHELLSRSERLSDRGHLAKLRSEADDLLDDWNHLTEDLAEIQSHGLNGLRTAKIRQIQQELVPLVGQIAAVLTQR